MVKDAPNISLSQNTTSSQISTDSWIGAVAGGWYRHRTDEVWREVVTSPLTHTALTETDSSHQALEQQQPHHSIPVTSHPGRVRLDCGSK